VHSCRFSRVKILPKITLRKLSLLREIRIYDRTYDLFMFSVTLPCARGKFFFTQLLRRKEERDAVLAAPTIDPVGALQLPRGFICLTLGT